MATYAGKYQGPDEFRGDSEMIAAWKKAGKPKNTAAFIKKYKADAKKPETSYKGQYQGPDVFKGDQAKIDAWKAAGKPDPAQFNKQYTPSIPANPAEGAPGSGVSAPPTVPVSDSTGKLVSPENWQADQARLATLAADQEALDQIYAEEDNALSEYKTTETNAQAQRDARMLAAKRQRDELNRNKNVAVKNVKTNTSYRGMGRSTAYNRQRAGVETQATTLANAIADEEGNATKDWSETIRNAALRKKQIETSLAPRKKTLTDRAAKSGVYTR